MGVTAGPRVGYGITIPSTGIITSGLIMHLDAGNSLSYPGTGTTWADLTGNHNGTLTNGAVYSSANGGSILFDGINDYVATNILKLNQIVNRPVSASLWFKTTSNTVRQVLIGDWNATGGDESTHLEINGTPTANKIGGYILQLGGGTNNVESTGTTAINTWTNVVLQAIDSTTIQLWVNGVMHQQLTGTTENVYNNSGQQFSIGRAGAYPGLYLSGNISQFLLYNKGLSSAEITQNYNALKGRYGL